MNLQVGVYENGGPQHVPRISLNPKPQAVAFSERFITRMPSSALIPFFGGLGSPINPLKQKRAPFLSLGYWAA